MVRWAAYCIQHESFPKKCFYLNTKNQGFISLSNTFYLINLVCELSSQELKLPGQHKPKMVKLIFQVVKFYYQNLLSGKNLMPDSWLNLRCVAKQTGTHQQIQPKLSQYWWQRYNKLITWGCGCAMVNPGSVTTPSASQPLCWRSCTGPHHCFCHGIQVTRWVFTHHGSCGTTDDPWHSKVSGCCGQISGTCFTPDEMQTKPVNGFFNKLELAAGAYIWPMWHVSKLLVLFYEKS